MGSSFFSGRELGPNLAPNSTIGRAETNDPVSRFLFGGPKQVLPTAGPYAGINPTLQMAQRGYATYNGQAGNAQNPGTSAQLAATFGSKVPM